MAAVRNGSFFDSVAVFLFRFSYLYVLLVSLLFLQVCLALYEDQVGLFDWRQQYIGKVKFAYFDHYSHSSRRALVATESNVIAALNARTGAIVWRKVFEKNQGNVNNLLRHADALLTVSGNGRVLRSWDPGRGHLIWESVDLNGDVSVPIKSAKTFAGLPGWGTVLAKKKNGGTFGVLSLLGNTVRLHKVNDGSEIWTWKRQASDADSLCLGVQTDDLNAYIVTLKSEAVLEIKILDLTDGKLKQTGVIPAPWVTFDSTKCIFVGDQYLACLDAEEGIFHVIDLKHPSPVTSKTPLSSVKNTDPTTVKSALLLNFGHQYDKAEFILQLSHQQKFVLSINKDNQVSLIKEFIEGELVLASSTGPKPLFLAVKSSGTSLNVNVFDADNFKEIKNLHQTLSMGTDHGRPELGAVYLFSKKDGEIGYRIILTNEDYSLCLVQQTGKVLWEREEALSGITSVEMVELPPSASESKLELLHEEFSAMHNAGIISMFLKRVKIQFKQLEVLMASLKKRKHYADQSGSKGNQEIARDQFGLAKVIIAVTESGKIFALDSLRGSILWTHFLPDLAPFESKGQNKTVLFTQRTAAHFPLPSQLVVIGKRRAGHGSLLFAFNPLTGNPADPGKPKGTALPYDILQVSSLPFTDERFTKAILLIDKDLKVHVFPETEESISNLHEKMSSIYLYLVNDTTGLCRGFSLTKEELLNGKGNVGVAEVWSVKIPDDQKILNVVSIRTDEHVHSVGRVLGDRSVLYKYLNPNLIAVSTITKDAPKPSVSIYIMDAVTGQIVHQIRHRNAENPVEMVLSENWLVYLYYNTKARRMEVSVVEMYEGFEEKNSTAFSSLDSLDHPLLALSQGYLLGSSGVNAISVTNTERGITHKNLLLALDSGHVYSLPKNLLDPRRSFDQTPQLMEEGLMPYLPELPLSPQAYLNYNMTVEKIRGIHTAAAGLESTSLVLTYGLDLYYTRVTPSRMFDVLKEDFDYIFISGVLSALILGTIISSKLASIRALNLQWL